MTRRNVMMSVTPWPTRINANADDPEHSGMSWDGRSSARPTNMTDCWHVSKTPMT